MQVTIKKDRMGCLHIWKGPQDIHQVDKYLFHNQDNKEGDLYLQRDVDVEKLKEELTEEQVEELENGYGILARIDELWFGDNI